MGNIIKKQNTSFFEINPNKITNTNPYLTLTNHLVDKGHFGYLFFSPDRHRENKGLVQLPRVETNVPRSIFLNNNLKKLQEDYNKKAISYLKSFPLCYNKFQEHEDFVSGMLKVAKNLCRDIFEDGKYKTEKIVYCLDNNNSKDYNRGTIKVIAYLNDKNNKDKQNGWQPIYEKYSDHPFPEVSYYQPTTRICLYTKVQDGIVLTKTIFPVRSEFLDGCEEYGGNNSDSEKITLGLEGCEDNDLKKTFD